MDRAIFTSKQDCFQLINISELLHSADLIYTNSVCSAYTDEIPEQDLEMVKRNELDLLIRFGFRILKGGILHAAKLGVWSLHHGDNTVNRGGPPTFWEVVNKEPVTGVTLLVLSEDLDGGKVINKAFVRTNRTSFHRNQTDLYWAGIELFCNALERLEKDRSMVHHGKSNISSLYHKNADNFVVRFYSQPLYRNPGRSRTLLIFISFWRRRASEAIGSIFRRQQWMLFYKFREGNTIDTSLFRYKKLMPPAGVDWADPFIVKKDGRYYIFFEELIRCQKKGHISYLEFDELGKLISEKPIPTLVEPYHLSYPFILELEEFYYMLPEAASCNSLWLYKSNKFPYEWKKHKQLMTNIALYDPTLLLHENIWYLFGTQKPLQASSPDMYLYIYFSDNLFSDSWKEHPQNPVTRDVRGARPAGRIFEYNGKIIRPGQLGAPKYGYGIRFWEITMLSPTEFEEQPIEDILPTWRAGLLATHTFNFVKGFSVVDAQE